MLPGPEFGSGQGYLYHNTGNNFQPLDQVDTYFSSSNQSGDPVRAVVRQPSILANQAFLNWLSNNNNVNLNNTGSRLTEHILAHWGVHNGDSRLQRPEYIGGVRSPIIISEIPQTSQSNAGAPQGNLVSPAWRAGSIQHRIVRYR
jgi:hypothetical protein